MSDTHAPSEMFCQKRFLSHFDVEIGRKDCNGNEDNIMVTLADSPTHSLVVEATKITDDTATVVDANFGEMAGIPVPDMQSRYKDRGWNIYAHVVPRDKSSMN